MAPTYSVFINHIVIIGTLGLLSYVATQVVVSPDDNQIVVSPDDNQIVVSPDDLVSPDDGGLNGTGTLSTATSDNGESYVFDVCPATVLESAVVTGGTSMALCPDDPLYCPTSSFIEAGTSCKGYAGSKCTQGGKQFVKDFVTSCYADSVCENACAIITAIAYQESGYAPNAKSWDWGNCNGSPGMGAIGMLQFDFASGIDPLPLSVSDQLEQLATSSAQYTTFADWASCTVAVNPQGSGFTDDMIAEVTTAVTWCEDEGVTNPTTDYTLFGCTKKSGGNGGTEPRCGMSWTDANTKCANVQCPQKTDAVCVAADQGHCYADMTTAAC